MQLLGLVLDRRDDLGMAVPGGGHGDAGGEVEEQVAVHVLDDAAAAALDERADRRGVYDGDTYSLSRASIAAPFGPGSGVRMSGTVRVVEQPHGNALRLLTSDYHRVRGSEQEARVRPN